MKRICWDCGCEYSPNLGDNGRLPKGYKVCPKCQSTNTKEYKRPIFKAISTRKDFEYDCARNKGFIEEFIKAVRIHNAQMCA